MLPAHDERQGLRAAGSLDLVRGSRKDSVFHISAVNVSLKQKGSPLLAGKHRHRDHVEQDEVGLKLGLDARNNQWY